MTPEQVDRLAYGVLLASPMLLFGLAMLVVAVLWPVRRG